MQFEFTNIKSHNCLWGNCMILQLAHICLKVSDLENTIDFYHRKLGLPIKFKFEKEGRLYGVYFQLGNSTFIEAFREKNPDVKFVNTGITHFCMQTGNIDAFIADMKAKGVPCTDKKLGCDQSWQTWLKDPDGNNFEIHEYTPQSAQYNGGVVQATF